MLPKGTALPRFSQPEAHRAGTCAFGSLLFGMEWILFTAHFLVFAVVHSALASQTVKAMLITQIPGLGRFYRLLFNLLALVWTLVLLEKLPKSGLILWSVAWPYTMLPVLVMLWAAFEAARSVFQLNASEFLGFAQLRASAGSDLDSATHRQLSTSGWYSRVRHPLYFFSMLFLISKPTMTAEHAVLVVFTGVYFYVGARREEERLQALFGESFTAWKATVPMFFPRIF